MKRSKHNLEFYKLLSCNQGGLVPAGLVEVLPGDTFRHSTSALIRVSPLLAPVMHPVHVSVHHWFVPARLVWSEWEDFITGGEDGTSEPVFPTITAPASGGFPVGSLADYLGCVTGVDSLEVSALPFRAYSLIFNEWYRDQDLVDPLVVSKASGADTTTNTSLVNVAWEKDYFTSSRPWPQKGPDVYLPLGTDAPIRWDTFSGSTAQTDKFSVLERDASGVTGMRYGDTEGVNTGPMPNSTGNNMYADLTEASSVTINQLRQSSAIQRFRENMARHGSRYVERLLQFGVKSSDARLQRPEYLGGGKQTIQFSEVLQTAEGTDPVGELRGHGIAALKSNKYDFFFEEHGYVITLISVKPRTMYAQGLPRTWNRRSKLDYWQPELQHIGQQEVLNKEVYADGSSDDDEVFGYQDRYDEYRRMESSIAGDFRSSELDFWHMARIFDSRPALNADFVTANPTDRIYAVPSEDVLWIMAYHNIKSRRLVAKRGSSFLS